MRNKANLVDRYIGVNKMVSLTKRDDHLVGLYTIGSVTYKVKVYPQISRGISTLCDVKVYHKGLVVHESKDVWFDTAQHAVESTMLDLSLKIAANRMADQLNLSDCDRERCVDIIQRKFINIPTIIKEGVHKP